jgi:hypothetical protein
LGAAAWRLTAGRRSAALGRLDAVLAQAGLELLERRGIERGGRRRTGSTATRDAHRDRSDQDPGPVIDGRSLAHPPMIRAKPEYFLSAT